MRIIAFFVFFIFFSVKSFSLEKVIDLRDDNGLGSDDDVVAPEPEKGDSYNKKTDSDKLSENINNSKSDAFLGEESVSQLGADGDEVDLMRKDINQLNLENEVLKRKLIEYENKAKAQEMQINMYKEKIEAIDKVQSVEEKLEKKQEIDYLVGLVSKYSNVNNSTNDMNVANAYNLILTEKFDFAEKELKDIVKNNTLLNPKTAIYVNYYLAEINFYYKKYEEAVYYYSYVYKNSEKEDILMVSLFRMSQSFDFLDKKVESCISWKKFKSEIGDRDVSSVLDNSLLSSYRILNEKRCE
jgi:TolA-binding protein